MFRSGLAIAMQARKRVADALMRKPHDSFRPVTVGIGREEPLPHGESALSKLECLFPLTASSVQIGISRVCGRNHVLKLPCASYPLQKLETFVKAMLGSIIVSLHLLDVSYRPECSRKILPRDVVRIGLKQPPSDRQSFMKRSGNGAKAGLIGAKMRASFASQNTPKPQIGGGQITLKGRLLILFGGHLVQILECTPGN